MAVLPSASIQAQARTGASIAGQVSDEATSAPLTGVLVAIEGTTIAALTDEGGRYRLEGVPRGPWILRAQRIGLATARVRITVPPEGTLTRDIALSVSALRLEDITVTADAVSRAEGELGTASVIERDAIEHITATSLAGVLQLVPGISTRAPGLGDVEQIALRTVPTGSSLGALSNDAGVGRNSADLSAFGTLIVLDGVPLSNNANLQSLGPRGGADLQLLSFATAANGGIDCGASRLPSSSAWRSSAASRPFGTATSRRARSWSRPAPRRCSPSRKPSSMSGRSRAASSGGTRSGDRATPAR